ncbi:hypothetical protein Pfo_008301 [Paulownia fortunei]|nr:hypothetical protein Pfo_008301 [Paulownia fortunei]
MDSSSRDTLLKLFDEMIEWKRKKKRRKRDSVKFNWTLFHLSLVRDYVSKLGLNSDLRLLSSAKLFKDVKDPQIVGYFTQEIREFFIVPKLHQLIDRDDTLKKNELVAVFINFLLQLLYRRTSSINSIEDRIARLEKELRFLFTVLGDKSLLDAELDQVQNLLAEIEAVANEAGSLVHSVVFSTSADRVFKTMDERLGVLLKHVHLLKVNIKKFSNLLPLNAKANITPKKAAVDSLFIVDSLLDDLENLLNQDNSLIGNVKDQLKILQQELMFSLSLLKDINVPPHAEMEEFKEHVIQIRGVAYEAEYLINSFLIGDAPFWYFSIRLPHLIQKIKLIGTRIQENKKNYDIGALTVGKNFSAQLSLQTKRNSAVDDIIVGFEDKATDILDQLVGGTPHLQIISIFGMPGLGKTTLAKKLYNHPSVNYKFDKCSWCAVSQTYQRKSLLIDILDSSNSELDKVRILNMEEESLAEHIYKSLKGRRYLIVMDDIWSSNVWDDLRRCFPDDGNGSRILFTSRNKDVAPPNSIIYALPSLSNDQCWELLKKKVFYNECCPSQLEGIGKEIAANCRGLPLAVVVIAGILSTMDKAESTWKNVGGNVASQIFSDKNNSMMQILELSYKHLPDHLKPCFLYFGAFPEDKGIPVRKLMRVWIAEGFIRKEQRKSSESVAEEYLMELIDKSLVIVAQRRSDGGVKACVVHDLLRELCLRIAEEENFLKLIYDNYSIYEKHQRLFVNISQASSQILRPVGIHVRSFFCPLLHSTLDVLNMKLLRVLDCQPAFKHYDLFGIDLLVHLKYLAVSCMPASIGRLVNLEFLLVKGQIGTVDISSVILKLLKLRYLNVTPQARYDEDCNTSRTNNLEFLSNVIIYNLKDEEMLKCSPNLRKLKCECHPFWVEENGAYRYPDLRFLTQLESLKMTTFHGGKMAEINFPLNIKKLTLSGLGLPWEKMSMIGRLPNLEVLKLRSRAFVGETWETRDDEFLQLRFLKLEELYLFQWNVASSEHFPKLQRLFLRNCDNLQEIPCEIGEIVTLQLIEIQWRCLKSLVESALQIEREQREIGNEELRVIMREIFERDMFDDYDISPSTFDHW